MQERKLQLLKNGLCFLLQSIEHFKCSENNKYDTEKELKYSTLHLFSGIFLILKEKLKREHWSLLFADVNKADEQSLLSGDFNGVNFTDCQNRLSNIGSVNFTKEHKKTFSILRKKRNKIEHFFESETLVSFKSTLAYGLDFAIEFIEKHLNSNLENDDKQNIEKIRMKCFELKRFVEEKMKKIRPKLDKQKVVVDCDKCNNKSVVPNEDNMKMECLFCYKSISENEYEDLYHDMLGLYRPKDLMCAENMICPECEGENCFVETKDKKNYFCLYCHYTAKQDSFSSCPGCGVIYQDNTGDSFQCSSCWERLCR